jgi:hypothetical protein
MMYRYHDGLKAVNLQGNTIELKQLFYPKSWLEATGYFKNKLNSGPNVIMFSSGPDEEKGYTTGTYDSGRAWSRYQYSMIYFALTAGVVAMVIVTMVFKKHFMGNNDSDDGYYKKISDVEEKVALKSTVIGSGNKSLYYPPSPSTMKNSDYNVI